MHVDMSMLRSRCALFRRGLFLAFCALTEIPRPRLVVVIVNDGKAQEMTCCPVGQNVLSSVAAEHHVVRTGLCLADEVATGMKDPATPTVLCTKINSAYLKLSAATQAKYVTGKLPGVIGQIAASYNVNDTCLCEEGSAVTLRTTSAPTSAFASRRNENSGFCAGDGVRCEMMREGIDADLRRPTEAGREERAVGDEEPAHEVMLAGR